MLFASWWWAHRTTSRVTARPSAARFGTRQGARSFAAIAVISSSLDVTTVVAAFSNEIAREGHVASSCVAHAAFTSGRQGWPAQFGYVPAYEAGGGCRRAIRRRA